MGGLWADGPGRAAAPPNPLLAVPNVTAHPSPASVPTSYYSTWHYDYLCQSKNEDFAETDTTRTCRAKCDLYWVWDRSVADIGERWHLEVIDVVWTEVINDRLCLSSADRHWPPDSHRPRQTTLVDTVALCTTATMCNIIYSQTEGNDMLNRCDFRYVLKVENVRDRRRSTGRLFQASGTATARARSPMDERRVPGTRTSAVDAERSRRRESTSDSGWINSDI